MLNSIGKLRVGALSVIKRPSRRIVSSGGIVDTKYVGTIDSSVGNPFTFKVSKSDNLGMAAAIANSGWILTWTDPRFDNGGFTASQVNVRAQTGSGFTVVSSEDATFYNFAGWFGAAQLPQGTQFTIKW